ncbi:MULTISPECIES: DUF2971 domain-containing protein [unclassified Sphingomonas]|uniref:DUF2971 domain-containing protein n=1 Tax=unclassified Sphingomonas TaxID=196159 RepID=UPI000A5DF5DC|nr:MULTISPECIES: DUF2971 domain-containing protein [unclassified Sphingomonas]
MPRRLYKYRNFSNRTLSMLIDDTVYFADPTTFNDPLDTKPALAADIDNAALETILARLIEDRTVAEMSAAAKTLRYRGPKTLDHIARHGRKAAQRGLADLRYNATDPEYEIEDPERFLLGYYVQEELLRRYDKGVFSLVARATCPLMWSHYGDQHRGLCIGYSVPPAATSNVRKMRYGGSRLVQASAVAAMLGGDDAARRRVDDDVLLRKAKPWIYEREWRLIGSRGEQNSPLELEEIVFGMRCATAVKYSVVQALAQRSRAVGFFEIREQRDSFALARHRIDISELASSRPRRCRDMDGVFDAFAAEIDPVKSSGGETGEG